MPRRKNRFDKGGWRGVSGFSLWFGFRGEHITSTPSSARQTSISQAINHLGHYIPFKVLQEQGRGSPKELDK